MIGSGKYSALVSTLIDALEPMGVCGVVLIVGTPTDTGGRIDVEIEAPRGMLRILPKALREMADNIEADMAKPSKEPGPWRAH